MVAYVNKPTPQDFIYAFVKNWASSISGGLSVPSTIISIYANNPNMKLVFAFLAIVGVVFASYSLWARERDERVKTQEELERQTAKLGRPEITLGLKNDDGGELWVCMSNHSDRRAVNVRADVIQCGDHTLRFMNLPTELTSGFSPNVQVCRETKELDIATTYILNVPKRGQRFDSVQLAIRYTDIDAEHEWVTFGKFFYNISTKEFELEKQWVEETGSKPKPILT